MGSHLSISAGPLTLDGGELKLRLDERRSLCSDFVSWARDVSERNRANIEISEVFSWLNDEI